MNEYTDKEKRILKQFSEGPFYTVVTDLSNKEFDNFVNKLIKDNNSSALTILVSIYWDYKRNKILDYFISKRDFENLINFLNCCDDFRTKNSELSETYIINKILETKDKDFVKKILESDSLYFLRDHNEKERLIKFVS